MVSSGADAEPNFIENLEKEITDKFKKQVEKNHKELEN